MKKYLRVMALCLLVGAMNLPVCCQNVIKGVIYEASNNDPVIGGSVVVQGTTQGTITDWDGSFEFETDLPFPLMIQVSYIGFETQTIEKIDDSRMEIRMLESSVVIEGVEVKASRISDKQKKSPLTIESLDLIAIKETPASDFYDGLGSLKGVDLTAASLGFKVINMRGFNSTSPVRSLQTIDGIDNQAPGLNFSLGNFLGSSELDVNKVELIVGASSAFYGPNAFNGVIGMETRDPFFHTGLSASIKVAERNLIKPAVRWADSFQNEEGYDWMAYKLNFEYMRADDWVADNFNPIDASEVEADNFGGFDAVNIYGDEYQARNDLSDVAISNAQRGTIGNWFRTGYKEEDLVDYGTRNYKANVAFHFKTNPSKEFQSPEIIASSSYGSGTTVYQGDNRFSLKGITFLQNRLEFRKKNDYFIRAYSTTTGAGESYDPYFTALQLQESAKENREWSNDYSGYWRDVVTPQILELGYPIVEVVLDENGIPVFNEDGTIKTNFDVAAAEQFYVDNDALLRQWHSEAENYANEGGHGASGAVPFFEPGTERFQQEFDRITGTLRSEGGTKFFDNSSLYHVHGEYIIRPEWVDKITIGSNYRLYTPVSKGTVFSDTADVKITNSEVGIYAGFEKSLLDNNVKVSFASRFDKNQNYDWLFSPAASIVYTPSENNFFRLSFSSAIRNPTLADQYLFLNVGPATLAGNLDGRDSLNTIESVIDFLNTDNPDTLSFFDIDPIRPEEVKTFEFGFRTTLFEKLFLDAGLYYSIYNNFIGFRLGADFERDGFGGVRKLDIFRFSANSENEVRTQGAAIGFNYYVGSNYSFSGNYSYNKLAKTVDEDPVIPAFNTPEHKFNIGFGGRNIKMKKQTLGIKSFGFNVNYKWIEGFIFEGSPQFTGFIPTYDMLDAQINFLIPSANSTIKVGASNILNNRSFQTFGGPEIGRLAYVSWTYEPGSKN